MSMDFFLFYVAVFFTEITSQEVAILQMYILFIAISASSQESERFSIRGIDLCL
jgi:general stress protein CsbA